jgi:hypothetical protein
MCWYENDWSWRHVLYVYNYQIFVWGRQNSKPSTADIPLLEIRMDSNTDPLLVVRATLFRLIKVYQ